MRLGLKTVGLTAAVAALALGASAAAGGERAKTTAQVGIEGTVTSGYYDPKNLTIHKGDKVNWTWHDNKGHSVWLKDGPNGVKNSDYRSPAYSSPGNTWAKRFRKPGEYKFFCSLHPTMTMKIEVKH